MRKNAALFALALLSLTSACAQGNNNKTDSVSLSDITSDASVSGDSSNEDSSQDATTSSEEVDSGDSKEDGTPNCLKLISSLAELKTHKEVALVAKDGSTYYGYTGVPKEASDGSTYSYYHLGEALTSVSGYEDLLNLGSSIAKLTLSFSDDKVSIQKGESYLWAGKVTSGDKEYANIGLKEEETYFNLDDLGSGDFHLYSDDEVYLEYYKNSFCGASANYKDQAIVSFYSYHYEEGLDKKDPSDDPVDPIDPDKVGKYWSSLDLSKSGNAFRADLQTLIKNYKTNSTTYKACLAIGAAAAAYPVGSSTFVPFYHAAPNVTEGVSGNGALATTTSGCNKEHTWPNSRGCGKNSGPAADPFIIRPTLNSENGSRSNYFYGYSSSNEWDPASCGYEYARGEAARVTLYAATAYYGTCGSGGSSKGNEPMELSNNPGDATSKHTMGTLKTLLEWNAKYAPTAMEIQINDYLYNQGYGRNPFVDEPKLATYIWDSNGVRA